MKRTRVAINGFGRIGRMATRVLLNRPSIDLVAINDLTDVNTLAHLFKYDSIHRRFNGTVTVENDHLVINGKKLKVLSQKDPSLLSWGDFEVDVLIESTGKFTDEAGATQHLNSGAKRVILSAPAKGTHSFKTIVIGVNDHLITGNERIISNASCTTNNAAPMMKVIDDNWGIESAYVTTVHSYTGDQNLHDAPHKDLRRARAAAVSIIPTTTGAAKALTEVFPALDGSIGGAGVRVPVSDGSLTDITCIVKKNATIQEINSAFRKVSETTMKNILEYTEDPIVSVDIIDSPYSCVFDSQLTSVLGRMVKVVGWYDNEIGYSNRLADLTELLVK